MSESVPRFVDFVPEVLSAVADTYTRVPFDDFDMGKVFVYLIAELFESTEPGVFFYTDGGRELGIDFYVQSDQSYYIYQCKSVDLETLEVAVKPPTFDANDVNQLLEAVSFMRDRKKTFKSAKEDVRELRTKYQRDLADVPEDTHLYATIAVLGDLTPGGLERFDSEQEALAAHGVTLRLLTWSDIYEALHALEPIPLKDMQVSLRVDSREKDVLQQKDWILGLVYAKELIDAYEKYGVRLFDMNVRNEIKGSKINRAIIESLKTARGRKNFHHFNNGLLVVCNNYRLPGRDGDPLVVHEPQVINGCQTVTSLWRAHKDLVPADQAELLNNVKVQVKVIQNMPQELIDDVVITTNNQNPMKARNLKSNSREQRDIQRSFRDLACDKWFYIRKDGEFESTSQRGHQVRWFTKKDYEVASAGRPRYRVLDNEAVAKSWYSFIGFSGLSLMGGVDYFGNDAVYERIFKTRPGDDYWQEFADPIFEKPTDEQFEQYTPTAYQYVLASAFGSFIKYSNPSPHRNRRDSIARLVRSKDLKGDAATGETTATQAEIAKALAGDQKYLRTAYLYNMENVLVELAAFILTRRYGALNPMIAYSMLQQPDLRKWCSRGFTMQAEDESIFHADNAVLWRIYEFLCWAIGQNYFTSAKYEIEAAQRPKAYFARRASIKDMKAILLESDGLVRSSVLPWKTQAGVSFFESLPDLENLAPEQKNGALF
ncbi:MAG TPA: AIPR family protein [Coriobacteriia bacterium]|jgi:hypothetical protein